MATARVAAEIVAFGSVVALAHLVPPAEFGRAAVALVVPTLATSLLFQGLGTPLVQRRSLERAHLESAALMSIVAGAGLALAIYKLAPHFIPLYGYRVAELFQLIAPVMLLTAIATVSHSLLERRLDFVRISVAEMAGLIGGAAMSLALAVSGLDAKALVLGAVTTAAITTGLMWACAPFPMPRWQRKAAREIAIFGTPASVASLLYGGFRNVDYLVLGANLGAAQVGYYYRAFQMGMEYQRKITGIMLRMAFPLYSRSSGLEDMRAMRHRITSFHSIVVFPLLAGLIALAPELVPWLFGERWEPAVVPVQILAVGGAFAALTSGAGPLVLAAGRPRALVAYNGLLLVSFATAVWWAASYGLVEVCIAVVGVNLAALLAAQYFLLKRIVDIPMRQLWDDSRAAVVASLALLAVMLPLVNVLSDAGLPAPAVLVTAGPAGALAYILVLRVLFTPAWRDVSLVARRVARRRPRGRDGRQALAGAGAGS